MIHLATCEYIRSKSRYSKVSDFSTTQLISNHVKRVKDSQKYNHIIIEIYKGQNLIGLQLDTLLEFYE